MKLQHIQVIIAVAEEGTIRGAARRLNRTQPAMTKALHQVEEDLGVSLFQRTPQGVKTTEMGEAVLARARSVAMEMERLENEVAQMKGDLLGAVRVCVSPAAATLVIPRALASFRHYSPDVDVTIADGLYPSVLQQLRNGHLDLVVGPTPPVLWTSDIRVEKLFRMDIVVATGARSKWRNATRLEELVEADWLMLGSAQGPGDIIAAAYTELGLTPPRIRTAAESFLAGVGALEQTDLVCTFPELLFDHFTRRGFTLQRIDIANPVEPLEICLLTRAEHPLTPAAEKLATCCRYWSQPERLSDAPA